LLDEEDELAELDEVLEADDDEDMEIDEDVDVEIDEDDERVVELELAAPPGLTSPQAERHTSNATGKNRRARIDVPHLRTFRGEREAFMTNRRRSRLSTVTHARASSREIPIDLPGRVTHPPDPRTSDQSQTSGCPGKYIWHVTRERDALNRQLSTVSRSPATTSWRSACPLRLPRALWGRARLSSRMLFAQLANALRHISAPVGWPRGPWYPRPRPPRRRRCIPRSIDTKHD